MKRLETLFKNLYGCEPLSIEALPASGSTRRYFRLYGNTESGSVIGTIGDEVKENEAFIYLSRHFADKGLPVPEVLAVSDDRKAYLQVDLEGPMLYDLVVRDGLNSESVQRHLADSMTVLADFHALVSCDVDTSYCYPRAEMDGTAVAWDLEYFKYCFLKLAGCTIDEQRLEDEMNRLKACILDDDFKALILRDFQSRNVLVGRDRLSVIDFQGARIAPAFYDVASFLWQARLGLDEDRKWELARVYVDEMERHDVAVPADWQRRLTVMALFRMLQVLGTYGFRGLHEHRAQFVTSIPTALSNALTLIKELPELNIEHIAHLLRELLADKRFETASTNGRLKVTVYSFSYKKGIPQDRSGNGGGFVFDCRAVHNPGRYEHYKKLTGRDEPVIRFLEDDGEIFDFLDNCKALVSRSVDKYLKRGFTNLMVSFGCTGGRHRSVYSAQKMAEYLAASYDVDVELIHREQSIREMFK